MTKVDKKTYYDSFQNLTNVTQSCIGDFPYEHHVKRNGVLIAKSVDRLLNGDEDEYMTTDYFVLK